MKKEIENKVFEVVKVKSNIRGYWKDENGKLYKDYIKLFSPVQPLDLENKIQDLFFKGEKAVFIRGRVRSFIIYPDNKQDVLNKNIFEIKLKSDFKLSDFRKLLKQYNGFTLISKGEFILIDVWTV
jgi:hypothetical protein